MQHLMSVYLFCLLAVGFARLSAGDVQVDTNGNLIVDTGTVRAGNVLQLPLPTSTTTLGVAATLDATAFGKWYLIGGTATNYDITLPAAANNAGRCIGFRVLDAALASKTYTLKPATTSEKIDGAATQALTASGSLVIMSDGTHWARVGGTSTGSGSGGTGIAALTDWQSYIPTFTNLGTVDEIEFYWRRIGDELQVQGKWRSSTSGAAASASISLPAGMTIDGSKVADDVANQVRQPVGFCYRNQLTTNDYPVLAVGGATTVSFGLANNGTVRGMGDANGSNMVNAGDRLACSFRVPVVGWSGAQVVQQGGRYLWAQRFASQAARVATTPSQAGQYRARRLGVDTAPTVGPSSADGFRIDAGSGIAAGRINQYDVYVGPGKVVQLVAYQTTGRSGHVTVDIVTSGSDYRGIVWSYDPTSGNVSAFCRCTNTGDQAAISFDATATYSTTFFDLLVADDPVPVALAPTVHVEASSDVSQGLTTGVTLIQYEDELADTHGAWNGSVFTAPLAGVYAIRAGLGWTTSGQQYSGISLLKNGAVYVYGPRGGFSSAGVGWWLEVTSTMQLAQGETISFQVFGDSVTRSATPASNRLSITRVGN